MNRIYLERHDPDKNMHRFYQMFVTPGIFGVLKTCFTMQSREKAIKLF